MRTPQGLPESLRTVVPTLQAYKYDRLRSRLDAYTLEENVCRFYAGITILSDLRVNFKIAFGHHGRSSGPF